MTHSDFRDLPNVLEREFDLGPGFRFEVFYVELHGVVTGDGNLLHRVIGLNVAKNKRCREGEERKHFHENQGMKVCVKSKSVRTDFWDLDFRGWHVAVVHLEHQNSHGRIVNIGFSMIVFSTWPMSIGCLGSAYDLLEILVPGSQNPDPDTPVA